MEHVKLLSIKFVATFILLYLILGIGYGMGFGQILTISLLSFATYYIGDLIILERTNNLTATIADFVINFTLIYVLMSMMTFAGDLLMAAFLSTLAVTIYEVFFHLYVSEDLSYDDDNRLQVNRYDYMTELSKEIDPFFDDLDDDEDYN
ncbi:YndM family protein [Amphibacillus sp. Q70]|uniref:YndM family protein n=1 Tax=Amphibacillus sp. Q70 TaxID=3453416 RepID=UPI003F87BBFF